MVKIINVAGGYSAKLPVGAGPAEPSVQGHHHAPAQPTPDGAPPPAPWAEGDRLATRRRASSFFIPGLALCDIISEEFPLQ